MTLPDRLGNPVDDREEPTPRPPRRCDMPFPEPEPIAPSAPNRRIRPLVVVAFFVTGALTGWLVAKMINPHPPTTDLPTSVPFSVAGTAELFTSLYLSGTSGEAITRVFAGKPPPPSGAWVNHAAAVAVHQVDADRWEVTVAVDSLESRDGQFESVPLGFFLVPMALSGERAMAIGPPARVPAPEIRAIATDALRVVPDDQAIVARRFVELHLQADPQAGLLLVNPMAVAEFAQPPYSSVRTEVVGADTLGRVIVAAQATTAKGAIHYLEYLVTLEASESGWQVAAIGSAAQ